MPSIFEISPSGRAKCRGCGTSIAKGQLRFGERMDNPYGEGEMSLWFHPVCGALKRPEPFLEALGAIDTSDPVGTSAAESTSGPLEMANFKIPDRTELQAIADEGITHPKLQRLSGVERAPSGRARCRSCKELIEKENWRLKLVFYQDGRFEPSGYVHVSCSPKYLETNEILSRLKRLGKLTDEEGIEIERELSQEA